MPPDHCTAVHALEDGTEVKKSDTRIGVGSFGSVYLGVCRNESGENEYVALKDNDGLFPIRASAAHEQENEIYESVPPHTNLVKYLGWCPKCEGYEGKYIVLEYLPMNLQEAIVRGNVLNTYRDVLNVLGGIVEGLIHLHKHHIVHFDLKPSNILLSFDLTPKIADFGISRIRLGNSITVGLKGTKGYMAPELMAGGLIDVYSKSGRRESKKRVTDSVDIFSFGMLAYVCVTGGKIPNDETKKRLIAEGKIVKCGGFRHTQAACDCPRSLREMIEKCLQFDVKELDTRNFTRPSVFKLRDMIKNMLMDGWIDDPLPRMGAYKME